MSLEVTATVVVPVVPVARGVLVVLVVLVGRDVVAFRGPMASGVPADRAVTLVMPAMAVAVLLAMCW